MTALLEARGLTYPSGPHPRLSGVDLSLREGELHAVLGPNGAGKSTLLRLLAGEIAPARGSIALHGQALAAWSAPERARRRAVLPQRHGLGFGFTAAEVVALGRLSAVRARPEVESHTVRAALAAAGASGLESRRYPTLSGGEQARVQLARVLAQLADNDRGVLLLDEPTAALDLAHREACLRALRAQAARGLGVLFVTHDPALALRHADTVTVLRDGRVVSQGPVAEALTAETLAAAFGVEARVLPGEAGWPATVLVR